MDRANVAATFHERQCVDSRFGYTQGSGRWGSGPTEYWECDGVTGLFSVGDRDCSSSVIDCWSEALRGSKYEGALSGATYTGNMRYVFVNSGLFDWHPMGDGYIAQRGDVYLNEVSHTAMCQSAIPDMLSEFSINEFGGITGGQVGDQTGNESHIRAYYNFPWDGILAYNGKADGEDWLDMATMDEVREAVWGAVYNNHRMDERLYLCNMKDFDTSDPTGRGAELDNHDHIKWIAARQNWLGECVQAIADKLEVELPEWGDDPLPSDEEKVGGTD